MFSFCHLCKAISNVRLSNGIFFSDGQSQSRVDGAGAGPQNDGAGCGETRGKDVLLPEDIAMYDGTHPSGKIMLVVLGQVRDHESCLLHVIQTHVRAQT